MAAIILAKNGAVLQRIPLVKERTTIGRRTYNDIVIDEPGVSAEHAELVFALGDLYFQDMGSTNGSRINGQPVQKHFMNDGDLIELGQHITMQYRADVGVSPLEAGSASGGGLDGGVGVDSWADHTRDAYMQPAVIEILDGHHAGQKIPLTQPLTTIGLPRIQTAVLARGGHGYSLTHLEGKVYPLINGKSGGTSTQGLSNGDLINLAGTTVRFSLCLEAQND
jgi:hypothetical protein